MSYIIAMIDINMYQFGIYLGVETFSHIKRAIKCVIKNKPKFVGKCSIKSRI